MENALNGGLHIQGHFFRRRRRGFSLTRAHNQRQCVCDSEREMPKQYNIASHTFCGPQMAPSRAAKLTFLHPFGLFVFWRADCCESGRFFRRFGVFVTRDFTESLLVVLGKVFLFFFEKKSIRPLDCILCSVTLAASVKNIGLRRSVEAFF